MASNNNIINYENIYENEYDLSNLDNNQNNFNNKKKGYINLLIYLFVILIGIGSLLVSSMFRSKTNTYILLERLNISEDTSVIITNYDEYLLEKDNFSNLYVVNYLNYAVISKNTISDDYKNWLDDSNTINQIINGNATTWLNDTSDNKESIFILYHFNSSIGQSLIKQDLNNYYSIISNKKINHNILINVFTYLIILIPFVFINYKRIFRDFDLLIKDKEEPFIGSLLSSFIMLLAATIASGFIINILSSMFNITNSISINQLEIEAMYQSKLFFLMIIMTIVAAPIVEEVVFRYSIYKVISNEKIAFHTSALSFGLIHLTTELQLLLIKGITSTRIITLFITSISYIVMGYFFSYMYKKKNKNLTFVILLHALNNLFASIAIFLN